MNLNLITIVVLFGMLACLSVAQDQKDQTDQTNSECSTDSDCNFGVCDASVCNCTSGYVSYNNETCNYQQKSQKTVYWISVLVGT